MKNRVNLLELGIKLIDESTSFNDWSIKFISQCKNGKKIVVTDEFAKDIFSDIRKLEIPINFKKQLEEEVPPRKERYTGRFDLCSSNETFEEYALRIRDSALIDELIELYKQAIERYEFLHNAKLTAVIPQKLPYDFLNKDNLNRLIPSEVRKLVWERSGGKCENCGSTDQLEYDHIIPISKGGSNSAKNIQVLCRKCNRKKSNKIE